ncbi:TPA: hypothetical protein NK775_001753 [Serratia marcescens]|nr:hypothetical protein [Serratia marcescens]
MKNIVENQDIKTDKPLPMSYEALKDERDAQQKRAEALAVENAAIKAMNDCLSEELRGYESDGAFEEPNMHHMWWKAETPATSEALAAIQAQAIEDAVNKVLFVDTVASTVVISQLLRAYAAALREAK